MDTKQIVEKWFTIWENGNFLKLPLGTNFKHTSPYGTVNGKYSYIKLVDSNKDKFLGNKFEMHDEIYLETKACIRYKMISKGFSMDVSEWFYCENDLISEIISYYNIDGEISEERKLSI